MKETVNKFKYSLTALESYNNEENIIENWRMELYSKDYQKTKDKKVDWTSYNEYFMNDSDYGNCDRQTFYMCRILKNKGYKVNFHYRGWRTGNIFLAQ